MRKLNLKILIFASLFLFSLGLMSATATLVTPNSSSPNVAGIYQYNVSFATPFDQVTNCTLWATSSSTANTTYVRVNTTVALNTSTNARYIIGNFSSAVIEDSNDYSVKASCLNLTNSQENTSANTNIVVDNGVPTAPSSLTPATETTDEDGSVTFTGTVIGENTTSCTLYFTGTNPGNPSYTMTHSANSCTYTLASVPDQTYLWYITASDGTNTSTSSTLTLHTEIDDGQGNPAGANEVIQQQKKDNTTLWIIIAIVVILAIVIAKRK